MYQHKDWVQFRSLRAHQLIMKVCIIILKQVRVVSLARSGERKHHREQTDGVFSCWIRLKGFHQQHVLPSSHSAAYLTQMLTNFFFTVMVDYWISLFRVQQSQSVKKFSSFVPQSRKEVLDTEVLCCSRILQSRHIQMGNLTTRPRCCSLVHFLLKVWGAVSLTNKNRRHQ